MPKQVKILVLLVFLSSSAFSQAPSQFSVNGNLNIDELWQVFTEYPDSVSKADMLIALGIMGKNNAGITEKINNYLTELNDKFAAGENVNYLMVSASISAIMELDDISSYPVLFTVLCAGYPEVIASEARGAIDFINGNLFLFLSDVVNNNPPVEKFAAVKAGIASERLSMSERGQLAMFALEQALLDEEEENANLDAMRYAAVLELASLRWTHANSLAVRHYYRILNDYHQGNISKSRYIEAITCLGAVGNSQAALLLGLQLGLINARTERTGSFDPEVTLAIVKALGYIGTNAAFDHLFYVSYLSYPDYIKIAAREAVDRLKW
ncbi:MAG: hypothetical protein FWC19_01310 [Treponema sp.]|nr:hypothetical protein [Treponema sp.]MCL2271430.1 hypothetical protein [Treponema sp.]